MLRALLAVVLAAVALVSPSAAASSGPVAVGQGFACALFKAGEVKCWGANASGQLGIGSTTNIGDDAGEMGDNLQPVLLGTGVVAVEIATGFVHACAMLETGKIKCWGDGSSGKLGLGDTTSRGTNATEMGDNLPIADLGTGYEAVEIACGWGHTCAILADGRLKCWGWNQSGQLGLGDDDNRGDQPGEMGDNLPFVKVQGLDLVAVAVAVGDQHTCAIAVSGDLFCWGYGIEGQLGLGIPTVVSIGRTPEDMANLQPVDLGAGRSAVSISLGLQGTCVLLNVGAVACFGSNSNARLGIGSTSISIGLYPSEMGDNLQTVNLGTGRSVAQVAAGFVHTCAVLDDGSMKCWGCNSFGEAGIESSNSIVGGDVSIEMGDNLPAVNLGTGRTVVWIALGDHQTCALLDDRSVKCWGRNNYGQLGQGHTTDIGELANTMGDALPPIVFSTNDTTSDFCQLGEYGIFGNCTSCPAGTWAPVGITIEEECVACETGKFSFEGAAGCFEDCPAGKYGSPENATCFDCPTGKFSNVTGADDITACELCPAGTYSEEVGAIEISTCLLCVPGKYSAIEGADACENCPAGTYSELEGRVSVDNCVKCDRGYYSEVEGATSSTACLACVAGKYSDVEGADSNATCQDCAAGTYSDIIGADDETDCQLCPRGMYSGAEGATDISTCQACGKGKYSEVEGATTVDVCTNCPAGTYSEAEGVGAVGDCLPCAAGTYSTAWGADTPDTCEPCAAGKYSEVEGANSSAACLNCAAGTYSGIIGADEDADCQLCPRGRYSGAEGATDISTCQRCGKGKYSEVEGAADVSTCENCPAGTFSKVQGLGDATGCQPCSAGRYSEEEGADHEMDCKPCAAGRYSEVEAANTPDVCIACVAGKYSTVSGADTPDTCQSCAAGKYSTEAAAFAESTCIDCVPGTYSTVEAADFPATCMACGAGKYSTVSGADSPTTCLACAAGKYSEVLGASSPATCENCNAGRYSEVEGADSETFCLFCEAGTYSTEVGASSNTTCTLCVAGTYSEEQGANSPADCTPCPADTYSPVLGAMDNSTCLPCPPKTHTKSEGAGDVVMCKEKQEDEAAGALSVVQDPAVAAPVALGLVAIIAAAVLMVRQRNRRELSRQTGVIPTPFVSPNTKSAEVAMTNLPTKSASVDVSKGSV